ncbi:hypothetical protein ACLMJV_33155, partial [Sinorhizobium meliloti]
MNPENSDSRVDPDAWVAALAGGSPPVDPVADMDLAGSLLNLAFADEPVAGPDDSTLAVDGGTETVEDYEQADILNETTGPSDRAGAKRGRPATEPEDGRAAQRRQVEARQVLGATDTHADRPQISASAALADPGVSGLPGEQPVIAPATAETKVGGTYPQPHAHLRQPLPSGAVSEIPLDAQVNELLQMDEAALQSLLPLAGPDDLALAERWRQWRQPRGGERATETAEDYEQADIQSASEEDMALDPSDEKMEGGPDLAAIAEVTPRRQGQSNGAWADELKAANPNLIAKDAAKIVGSTQAYIAKRAAFQAVSAEEKMRLAAIAEATPRRQGQSNGAWADELKAANPNLIAKDAAIIVGSTQ